MAELDERIVRVSINVNGQLQTYEGLNIQITGTKYANANQNDCEIKIFNLQRSSLDFILTETSPFNLNRTPKRVTVEAGRVSYGTTRIFTGDVISSGPTQPPDVGISLKSLTGNYLKGDILSTAGAGVSSLFNISSQVSTDLGLVLDFQATNKSVGNYNYSGSALKQVDSLGELGNIDAYIDDSNLVVKDSLVPLVNSERVLNIDTGMVGIPELTAIGIKVKYLLDNRTKLGGALRIQSIMYPAANGVYVIYKLGFDIASRDVPFYWIAEGRRIS